MLNIVDRATKALQVISILQTTLLDNLCFKDKEHTVTAEVGTFAPDFQGYCLA